MCLAVPAQVLARDGDTGRVRLGDATLEVSLMLVEDVGIGDWVLVHAGFAIQQVDEDYARETLRIFEAIDAGEDGQEHDSVTKRLGDETEEA